MRRRPWLAIIALACLVGCAQPPPEPRHRCVTIPTGMVECQEIPPDAPAPR